MRYPPGMSWPPMARSSRSCGMEFAETSAHPIRRRTGPAIVEKTASVAGSGLEDGVGIAASGRNSPDAACRSGVVDELIFSPNRLPEVECCWHLNQVPGAGGAHDAQAVWTVEADFFPVGREER